MRKICIFFILFISAVLARAQSPLIMPIPEQQFFTPGGQVCSGCFVYTYISGTNTPQATYTDATGLTANTNPIILNAAGFPQTAIGAQVGIWLSPTATYRIVLQNAAHSILYTVDGITGAFPGSTTNPISILDATCNQLIIGVTNFQTGLCFPQPTGNITLTFPATSDTMVGRATTDTLTNKTLISPTINTPVVNSVQIVNGPATYFTIANASPSGTVLFTLTKIINTTSQATQAVSTDLGGIVGITVSGAGTTGNATIQAEGQVNCVFDGPTTANDYVQNSTTVNGDCHDAGASYPQIHQVIGRVLSTNGSNGTYAIVLFPPEIQGSAFANVAISIANAPTPGTSANTLTKLTGAPSAAVQTLTTDTGGIIGITVSGAGTSGNAQVQEIGLANCIFDGATTANHYFTNSTTVAGDCHDFGATLPTGTQVLGRVLSSNGGGGTYSVLLFSPEINYPTPATIPVISTGSNSSVCTTGTTAGATCTTTVTWNITFANTSYYAVCSGVSATGAPYIADVHSETTTSITVTISNGQGSQAIASTYSSLQCIGVHP